MNASKVLLGTEVLERVLGYRDLMNKKYKAQPEASFENQVYSKHRTITFSLR